MRNTGLEAIRGFAAVVVWLSHIREIPGCEAEAGFGLPLSSFLLGGEAVLVFFLLSGTVIRLSFDRTPRAPLQFLWTRAIRLLPLYLCACIFSVTVLFAVGRTVSPWQFAGHLLFLQTLQNFICPVFDSNNPLWSLSFEIFFYVVFALTIGRHQQRLLKFWFAIGLVAAASQVIWPMPGALGQLQMLTAYSTIWLFGYFVVDIADRIPINFCRAVAWIGMLPLADRVFRGDDDYLAATHFLAALTVIPLFMLLVPSKREDRIPFNGKFWLVWALSLIAMASTAIMASKSKPVSILACALFPCVMLVLGFICDRMTIRSTLLTTTVLFLGRISYSLYIFHYPVFYLVGSFGFQPGLALAVALPLSLLVAILAEYSIPPVFSMLLSPQRRGKLLEPQIPRALAGFSKH